jgi:GMP synthase (glutamine-hydrolysing)
MAITELKADTLNARQFIQDQIRQIAQTVGDGIAITALSGGVDSSVCTLLAHRALGDRLKTYFVENGLMRQDEPQRVAELFARFGVNVEIVPARKEFFRALKGLTDPEQKRGAITQTFYAKVFRRLVKQSGARFLVQGTILTDVEETVAGIKRQHNVLEQLGIDPRRAYGYTVVEPVIQLRKDGVRKVAKALGLPKSLYARMPFPGPALAARVVGEATPERIALVRKATAILEAEMQNVKAFQYMAILHEDRFPGMREGKRDYGLQIEIRCWDSVDARLATPVWLTPQLLKKLARRMTEEVPGVVSVTYNIAPKPPSTMEAV